MANLVIINGAPGVGKSTLLQWLAPQLALPALAKDDVKEFLFDKLGYQDRDWSRLLGRAANEMLYVAADEFLAEDKSFIIENAFQPEYAKKPLSKLIKEHEPYVVEVYCTADDEVRLERFMQRLEDGTRHPGHVDNLATFRDFTGYGPLSVGETIQVDLTEANSELYNYILEQIRQLTAKEDEHAKSN